MMLVEIPDINYELFSQYRDRLWKSDVKCGVVSAEYSKDLMIARFFFLDGFYVPKWLETYTVKPEDC